MHEDPEAVGGIMTLSASTSSLVEDRVSLTLPASAPYLSLLRSTVAHLAARLDFTIEEIDDVRMAADEAANLLLAASDGSGIELSAHLGEGLRLELRAVAVRDLELDDDSLSWIVLGALADEVSARTEGDHAVLTLTKTRSEA
jgi:serine/threonine-protein kinase RsbW